MRSCRRDEARGSAALISAFIDQQLEANPEPATQKQIDFARNLAEEKGIALDPGFERDKRKLSAKIDEMLGNNDDAPHSDSVTWPTGPQLLAAAAIARENRIGLPAEAVATRQGCSAFIEQNGRGAGTAFVPPQSPSPAFEPPPVSPMPPPLENRDHQNHGRYPY